MRQALWPAAHPRHHRAQGLIQGVPCLRHLIVRDGQCRHQQANAAHRGLEAQARSSHAHSVANRSFTNLLPNARRRRVIRRNPAVRSTVAERRDAGSRVASAHGWLAHRRPCRGATPDHFRQVPRPSGGRPGIAQHFSGGYPATVQTPPVPRSSRDDRNQPPCLAPSHPTRRSRQGSQIIAGRSSVAMTTG